MDWMELNHANQWELGKNTRGCKHCGTTETSIAANGKAIWHHPGLNCCKQALQNQLTWRQNDLQQARNEYRQAENHANNLDDQAQRATGPERTTLNNQAQRARAALPYKEAALRLRVDGDPTNDIIGIKNEIRELEQRLAQW